MRFPDRLRRFDDEGRCGGVELVGVRRKPAVFGLLEGKGERVKGFACTQPDEAAGAQLDVGPVGGGVAGADSAVQAVAGDHQIGLVMRRHGLVVGDIGFEHQIDTQRQAAILEDIEQVFAADAAKAVTARTHAAAFEKHLHIVPVIEGIADQRRTDRVGSAQVGQGLVRQHDAPAKGVKGPVAFDHRHLVRRVLELHQQREIQTGRAAAQAQNPHRGCSLN